MPAGLALTLSSLSLQGSDAIDRMTHSSTPPVEGIGHWSKRRRLGNSTDVNDF
jgi:hypothetical protein